MVLCYAQLHNPVTGRMWNTGVQGVECIPGVSQVVSELRGQLPRTVDSLLKQLPGVGRYTAAAIGSIALDQVGPHTHLETCTSAPQPLLCARACSNAALDSLTPSFITDDEDLCCLGYWSSGWQCDSGALSPEGHWSWQYKSCSNRGTLVRWNFTWISSVNPILVPTYFLTVSSLCFVCAYQH